MDKADNDLGVGGPGTVRHAGQHKKTASVSVRKIRKAGPRSLIEILLKQSPPIIRPGSDSAAGKAASREAVALREYP